jgi:hypothetical protein
MRLVLTLPGLVAADPSRQAPALARLLAAAGAPASEPRGLATMLAAEYGIVAPEGRDAPLAPILAAAAGATPGDAYWLVADPVTLVAGRDDVLLAGRVDDLAGHETTALLATLNGHFADDGIAFVAPAPSAWFVRTATTPALVTPALDAAAGRPLRELLPQGTDAPRWRRWQNEIQMLLHAHAVNEARAAGGRAPVTSVWFWGGGRATTAANPGAIATGGDARVAGAIATPGEDRVAGPIATWGDDRVAAALAHAAGATARALPAGLAPVLATTATLHVVALPADAGNPVLAPGFVAEAWTALLRGQLSEVTIIADGMGAAWRWSARRPGFAARAAARAGWRRPALAPLLAAARDR